MYLYHKLRTQVGYILSILLYVITPFMPSSFLLKFPLSILSPHNSLRARPSTLHLCLSNLKCLSDSTHIEYQSFWLFR